MTKPPEKGSIKALMKPICSPGQRNEWILPKGGPANLRDRTIKFQLILFAVSLVSVLAGQAAALENFNPYPKTTPIFRIYQANDAVQPPGREPTDNETSNIMAIEAISALTNRQPKIAEVIAETTPVSLFGSNFTRFWTGFELSQAMLTPDNLEEEEPQMKERAPAGLLFFAVNINGENQAENISRKFGIWGGVIGPMSGAGQLQNWVHSQIFNGNRASCWKNQIGNTPFSIAGIDQSEKLLEYHPWADDDLSFKAIIKKGLYIGSSASAATEIELQFGWNPGKHDQYGATRIGPQYAPDLNLEPMGFGKPLSSAFLQSLFVFYCLRMDAVVYDQTLTGRELTPRLFVFKLMSGLGMVINLWNYPLTLTLAATTETKRYDEQKDSHSMATLSISGLLPSWGGGNNKSAEHRTRAY